MKIALIGSAPSSVRLAPYASKDWQIWGCSPGVYGVATRVDAWFELHRYEPGQPWFSPEYCQWMAKFPGPVFMAEVRPEIPNSRTLPIKEMIAKYGPYFFTSSLSYMFALAIDAIEAEREEQTKKGEPHSNSSIGLWGVDMAATEEYGYQRAGCQYFAMIAKAKWIEVGVPPESDLLRPPPLYGISEVDHARIKITARRRELQQRLASAQHQAEQFRTETMFLQGALDDLSWNENTWTGSTVAREYVEPPLVPAMDNLSTPRAPSAPIIFMREDNLHRSLPVRKKKKV